MSTLMPEDRSKRVHNDAASSALRYYSRKVYDDAWSRYRTAGAPFGDSDVGMLIWFVYDQGTRMN